MQASLAVRSREQTVATSKAALSRLTLAAVLVGLVVRIIFVQGSDFPLNDGGMFYAMVRDLQAAHFVLPAFTSYNAAAIPFAYPPLGFYLAGSLAGARVLSLIDVLRYLPLVANVLSIVAFAYLCRRLVESDLAAVVATWAFALLPRSFQWLIMGGGLTRSLGFLFALVALYQACWLYERPSKRRLALAAVFAALTVLTHLEMAWFLAYSLVLLLLARGRNGAGLRSALALGLATCLLSSPWWLAVIARHGIGVFVSAGQHGWPASAGLLIFLVNPATWEAYFPVLAFLAFVGACCCLAARRWFLPVWLLSMVLLDPRSAFTTATVPLAVLAGIGYADGLLPLLGRAEPRAAAPAVMRRRLPGLVLASLLAYTAFSTAVSYRGLLSGLSGDERAAMQWAAANTPGDSKFLVISGDDWTNDRSAEWFPVLAQRASVGTVQGAEWSGGPQFARRIELSRGLQRCALQGTDCLEAWAAQAGVAMNYVYVPKRPPAPAVADSGSAPATDCCWALRDDLSRSAGYTAVYDGPGAVIYSRQAWITPARQ